jgi:hypothetical protein
VELMIARRLEAELPKARILELYLNLIEWGDEIWGAEAAARAYFGTSASDLSPEQAALLAGAIINPRMYSPGHPNARLLGRQRIILGRMGAMTPPPPAPVPAPFPVAGRADWIGSAGRRILDRARKRFHPFLVYFGVPCRARRSPLSGPWRRRLALRSAPSPGISTDTPSALRSGRVCRK